MPLFAVQNNAWRRIFWMSLPPGLLFAAGSLFVAESPRWLYRRGRTQQALASLLRSRTPEAAALELAEMGAVRTQPDFSHKGSGSLLRRKYVVPFLLACVILRLQYGYRNQLDHRLQHQHSAPERPHGSRRTLGLCFVHIRQLSHDDRRHYFGRSQRTALSTDAWHRRSHAIPHCMRTPLSPCRAE